MDTQIDVTQQRSFPAEVSRTWNLAWPVFMVHLTFIAVTTIDVIMVGRYSTAELAYLNIGRILYWMALTVCSGLLSGVTVFTARKDGAGEQQDAADIFRQGLVYAGVLAVIFTTVLLIAGEAILGAAQLPEDLVHEGGDYIVLSALGLPFQLASYCGFLFLEGISRPRPGMIITVLIMPLNVALNWLFIEGNMGAPEMGASGAALATSFAQIVSAGMMFLYLRGMHDSAKWGFDRGSWKNAWTKGKALRRFGYAPGFATGMEFVGFNALNVMTGYLGLVTVSAFAVMFSLHAISFAIAMGFASATAVRVGNAMGRKDFKAVAKQVKLSALLTSCAMAPFAIVYLGATDLAIMPFGVAANVASAAAGMLILIAPFIILDGLQYMLVFALRAAGDEVVAAVLQVGSFLIVMAGSGGVLAFTFDLGADGIVYGLAAGIACAFVLLTLRFIVVNRRLLRQSA